MPTQRLIPAFATALFVIGGALSAPTHAALPIAQDPLFAQSPVAPLNMLVVGRDHKLYYEAYNDASDLNGDDVLDVGYKGHLAAGNGGIDYFGYFDSYKCYSHDGTKFSPTATTSTKRCSGAWSGDFLNYLATARIDALRKTLYGGKRSTDSTTSTVLEASFIPQDAHSWGKEYTSVAVDGYDIANFAPLSAPTDATRRILFAMTSTADGTAPILRVLNGSTYRVWEWVSIERPVAGTRCLHGGTGPSCVGGAAAAFPGHPGSAAAFQTMEDNFAIAANRYGSTNTAAALNCNSATCNTFNADQDNYLTVVSGQIRILNDGAFQFRVDGDDVIDFVLRSGSATGPVVATAGCYNTAGRGFGACGGAELTASVNLAETDYWFEFRHEEGGGGDGYRLDWQKTSGGSTFGWQVTPVVGTNNNGGIRSQNFTRTQYDLTPTTATATMTDYVVRVEVCASEALKEPNCRAYPDGQLKPTGLLHDYGETDQMYFGLLTGSQRNNLQGGVLRRNISSFASEIDADTGQFQAVDGIVKNLNALRPIGFSYASSYVWSYSGANCPALGYRAMQNGECRMWGNPVAEMMYEALRYYAGATDPTAAYAAGGSSVGETEETTLGLSAPTWSPPYSRYPSCARPFQTVISDVNPSYDSDLPGSAFNSVTIDSPATLASFNAATEGQTIWNQEYGSARDVFIGRSAATDDGAPTAKNVSSLGNIRGLAPEEPTKEGSYYAASVARFGRMNDVNAATGDQKPRTYSVALASPLPRITFPIGERKVTLVPFAKSIAHPGQTGDFRIPQNVDFRPTNTIVDFYVQKIVNLPGAPTDASVNGGRPYAEFRINYEDVEQGNDHDMDVIVRYIVQLTAADTVSVRLVSEYQAGSVMHHVGYVISGTTADGVYLEVRDADGNSTNVAAVRYKLDTPPGVSAGGCSNTSIAACNRLADGTLLPLDTTRSFTVRTSGGSVAEVLPDPLWFAAKYGGFKDELTQGGDADGVPEGVEWDADANGDPDNYFLVTNAGNLADQLRRAFDQIAGEARATGGIAVSGVRINANSLSYEPRFNSGDWTGDLWAYRVTRDGRLGANVWKASDEIPDADSRKIFVVTDPGTTPDVAPFTVAGLGGSAAAVTAIGAVDENLGAAYASPLTIDDAIDYLRGDQADEETSSSTATGKFRKRESVLGDIIGSRPEVSNPNDDFGYATLPDAEGGGDAYEDFLAAKASRLPAVYVAANDGMLHAFDSRAAGGDELFAFIPSTARAQMAALLSPAYTHRYLNDGRIAIGDAYVNSGWKTVLLSSVGAGGRSVYALDVTNPSTFAANSVLWELSNAIDGDIGTAIGQPVISRTKAGWMAIFGNGYNSDGQDAVLYAVNLGSGVVEKKIVLANGTDAEPNGVGNIAVVDTDDDGYDDAVFAGDYQGNLWRVNVAATSSASWAARNGSTPLFVARDADDNRQSITGGISVGAGPQDSVFVYFGTGRYLLVGDNNVAADPQVETFYSIHDTGTAVAGRASLGEQTITGTGTTRKVSANDVDLSTDRGWYLDLKSAATDPLGERFIGTPLLVLGQLFFITFQPVGTSCSPGGINRLYYLDALTGASNPNATPPGTPNVSSCEQSGTCEIGGVGPPIPDPTVVAIGQNPQDVPGNGDPTDPDDPQCAVAEDGKCVRECKVINPDGTCATMCPVEKPFCVSGAGCRLATIDSSGTQATLMRPCGRQSWRQVR